MAVIMSDTMYDMYTGKKVAVQHGGEANILDGKTVDVLYPSRVKEEDAVKVSVADSGVAGMKSQIADLNKRVETLEQNDSE